jgi:acid phosphatase family membrane protein YuiD
MFSDLGSNIVLIISAATWVITQILKVLVILVQEKRLDWSYFLTSGGMPSSHSATVCALATSIAMTVGLASVYFSISVVLAVIVMYDAAGVRQSVGQHSEVLNRIVKQFKIKSTKAGIEQNFREFIGHTPFQVFIGAVLGILISWSWVTIAAR